MLQIITGNAKPLTEKAFLIQEGADVNEIINGMWEAMYKNKGIGLAANQIGELKRIIVMDVQGLKLEVINPILIPRKGGMRKVEEGCLSFPNKKVMMRRYKRVVLCGFDKNWKPIKRKLSGLSAVCAQHEVDHLNGITIFS